MKKETRCRYCGRPLLSEGGVPDWAYCPDCGRPTLVAPLKSTGRVSKPCPRCNTVVEAKDFPGHNIWDYCPQCGARVLVAWRHLEVPIRQ